MKTHLDRRLHRLTQLYHKLDRRIDITLRMAIQEREQQFTRLYRRMNKQPVKPLPLP